MGNRFPGPKSAVFKGSLGAHTLINAAVSLLAQSSLAQLYLSRVTLLQRPFPITLILVVHSVPAAQELSMSIYTAWLSALTRQPCLPNPLWGLWHTQPEIHHRDQHGLTTGLPTSCCQLCGKDHRTERNFLVCECLAHSRLEPKCHRESLMTDHHSVKVRGKHNL